MESVTLAYKFLRHCHGVAAIEFALIAPVLLFAVLGVVDVGFIFAEKSRLNQFTRELAAKAMTDTDTASLSAFLSRQITLQGSGVGGQSYTHSLSATHQCDGVVAGTPYMTCSDGSATQYIVDVTVSVPYDGYILPNQSLASTLRVVLR